MNVSAYFAKPAVKNTILPPQSRHSVWHVRGKNKKTKKQTERMSEFSKSKRFKTTCRNSRIRDVIIIENTLCDCFMIYLK